MSWRDLRLNPFPAPVISSQEWRTYTTVSLLNWVLSAAFLFAALATVANSSLSFSPQANIPSIIILLIIIAVLLVATSFCKDKSWVVMLNTVCLIAAVHFSSTVVSYTSQYWAAKVPLGDALIARADSRLGFNWAAWRYWLNERFVLENALRAIYSYSLPVQLGLLTCVQSFASLEVRMQRLCFAAQLSLLITLVIAALFPTLGPYHYFGLHSTANAPNLFPAATGAHVDDIFNLRSTSPIIPFERMQGIITFPSFHAELGILFVWSVWPVPLMRLIAIAINGLMIAAVPLCGAHYLTDVIAGAVVAGAAIFIETVFLSFLVFFRAPEIGASAKLATSGPASDPPV